MHGQYPDLSKNLTKAEQNALAESFSERVLRCAGLVLTEGSTVLGHRELEILVVLRMNREFM
eukprot:gene18052-biopygen3750